MMTKMRAYQRQPTWCWILYHPIGFSALPYGLWSVDECTELWPCIEVLPLGGAIFKFRAISTISWGIVSTGSATASLYSRAFVYRPPQFCSLSMPVDLRGWEDTDSYRMVWPMMAPSSPAWSKTWTSVLKVTDSSLTAKKHPLLITFVLQAFLRLP